MRNANAEIPAENFPTERQIDEEPVCSTMQSDVSVRRNEAQECSFHDLRRYCAL